MSEDLVIPVSVKRTRAKRRKSDEDVWEWPDNKIIGMHETHSCYLCLFKYVQQKKAEKRGSLRYTVTIGSHSSGAV